MSILVTTFHVVTAVFIIGPLAVLPMLGLGSLRSGNPAALLRLAKTTNLFAFLSLLVFVLGFGALALSNARDSWTILTPWIAASVILYLAGVSLALFVTAPVMRTGASALEQDPADARGLRARRYRTIAMSSGFSSIAFVAIAVLMVWKP